MNTPTAISQSELDALEKEYVQLAVAALTDDVDFSPSTAQVREERLEAIETQVWDEHITTKWAEQAEEIAKKSGYASGLPYPS